MRRILVLMAVLALVAGCASKTTPDEWRQYARGAYLQGVADGKADVKCRPVIYQNTITIAPAVAPACEQAKVDASALTEVSKQADYDLTNNKKPVERQRSLMRYIELGGKAAQ
jgi:hypothetical protein